MLNQSRLGARITTLINAANKDDRANKAQIDIDMKQYVEKARLLYQASKGLATILQTQTRELASQIDNADLTPGDTTFECKFHHTQSFPATASIRFNIGRGVTMDQICVTFDALVLPIHLEFERHDEIVISVAQVDSNTFSQWVEDKIIGFVETYLRIKVHPSYQQSNMTTDPVCGMSVNKLDAVSLQYGTENDYFCSTHCRDLHSERASAQGNQPRGRGG